MLLEKQGASKPSYPKAVTEYGFTTRSTSLAALHDDLGSAREPHVRVLAVNLVILHSSESLLVEEFLR